MENLQKWPESLVHEHETRNKRTHLCVLERTVNLFSSEHTRNFCLRVLCQQWAYTLLITHKHVQCVPEAGGVGHLPSSALPAFVGPSGAPVMSWALPSSSEAIVASSSALAQRNSSKLKSVTTWFIWRSCSQELGTASLCSCWGLPELNAASALGALKPACRKQLMMIKRLVTFQGTTSRSPQKRRSWYPPLTPHWVAVCLSHNACRHTSQH